MRLLVAVDVTEAGEGVVDGAAAWAVPMGATVDLLYVDDFPVSARYVHDPRVRAAVEAEWSRQEVKLRARLAHLMHRLPVAQRGEVRLLRGLPGHVLVDEADHYDAVVVATHGRTGIVHAWLGSVAERVVRTVKKPVIVLHLARS